MMKVGHNEESVMRFIERATELGQRSSLQALIQKGFGGITKPCLHNIFSLEAWIFLYLVCGCPLLEGTIVVLVEVRGHLGSPEVKL